MPDNTPGDGIDKDIIKPDPPVGANKLSGSAEPEESTEQEIIKPDPPVGTN